MEGIVYAIIDNRIKTVVTFHDVLNVLHTKRGMGAAIMELKMAQTLIGQKALGTTCLKEAETTPTPNNTSQAGDQASRVAPHAGGLC